LEVVVASYSRAVKSKLFLFKKQKGHYFYCPQFDCAAKVVNCNSGGFVFRAGVKKFRKTLKTNYALFFILGGVYSDKSALNFSSAQP